AWWEQKLKELPKEIQKIFPFLYVPKASKSERNKGLDKMPSPTNRPTGVAYTETSKIHEEKDKGNVHPTVKPIKLMSYLIILTTREGDVVLDPFIGSGTTAISALLLNRKFIGFEINKEYFDIAQERIKYYLSQRKL
ncbi:MAG: DNA methyltransferase, partial [Candidatus Micrarchaeia archaeon]